MDRVDGWVNCVRDFKFVELLGNCSVLTNVFI